MPICFLIVEDGPGCLGVSTVLTGPKLLGPLDVAGLLIVGVLFGFDGAFHGKETLGLIWIVTVTDCLLLDEDYVVVQE